MNRIALLAAFAIACTMGASVAGCTAGELPANGGTPEWPTIQADGTLALVSGGYGYELADIVFIDTQRPPQPGDIVQYDDRLNGSDCGAFGPGQYLARIVASAGVGVVFQECAFELGGYTATLDCGPGTWPKTQHVYWGAEWFEDIDGMTLEVPEGEYLADRWIGQECRHSGGDSRQGSRFTIRSTAVIGVVVKRIGHDDRLQEYLEGIRY